MRRSTPATTTVVAAALFVISVGTSLGSVGTSLGFVYLPYHPGDRTSRQEHWHDVQRRIRPAGIFLTILEKTYIERFAAFMDEVLLLFFGLLFLLLLSSVATWLEFMYVLTGGDVRSFITLPPIRCVRLLSRQRLQQRRPGSRRWRSLLRC